MFEQYGGKRPALHFWRYRLAGLAGGFAGERVIDWPRVGRIIMVCSGNICRSPYAEVRLRDMGFAAASCGTSAIEAAPANDMARRVAAQRGTDLSGHSSNPIACLQIASHDLILVLEPQHLPHLQPVAGRSGAQLSLLGLWCSTSTPFIPDPYDRTERCFNFVFDLIDDALGRITARLMPTTTSSTLQAASPRSAPMQNGR